jgi:hypothetical protein
MVRWGLAATGAVVAAVIVCATATASSVTRLPFAGGGWMAVDGTHSHVFVSGGAGTSSIVVLDFSGTIVATIAGQQGASGLVVDEANGILYAALRDGTAISKIDTTTLAEVGRMSVATTLPGYCPTFATSAGNTDLLAVGDMGLSPTTLYVYDVSTDPPTLVKSVSGPGGAGNLRSLAFSPDAQRVLMASGAPYQVKSFLASDLTLAATYPTGPYPIAVAVSSDGAYVAAGADASYEKDVFVFPVGSTTPVRSWDFASTGKRLTPGGLAFSPNANKLFATSTNDASGKLDFRVYSKPTVPLLATTTSLAASKSTVNYGKSLTLTAHVTGTKTGKVRLYAKPYGGTKMLLKTASLSSGTASFTAKPRRKTTYSAAFVENDTYASSTSSGRTVAVRARTTLALRGGYGTSGKYRLYHAGSKAYMTGTVVPNHAGSSLKFVAQRYYSGGWHTVASATYPIQSDGSAYAYFYTNGSGSYRTRCTFGGDADHLGSSSTWRYIRFT